MEARKNKKCDNFKKRAHCAPQPPEGLYLEKVIY